MRAGSLLADLPEGLEEEEFTALLDKPTFRLERIVSIGHGTLEDAWYDQPQAEWVVVLKGSARVLIEGEPTARSLSPGDRLLIPAHVRHRVDGTDPDQATVWLALHYSD